MISKLILIQIETFTKSQVKILIYSQMKREMQIIICLISVLTKIMKIMKKMKKICEEQI